MHMIYHGSLYIYIHNIYRGFYDISHASVRKRDKPWVCLAGEIAFINRESYIQSILCLFPSANCLGWCVQIFEMLPRFSRLSSPSRRGVSIFLKDFLTAFCFFQWPGGLKQADNLLRSKYRRLCSLFNFMRNDTHVRRTSLHSNFDSEAIIFAN